MLPRISGRSLSLLDELDPRYQDWTDLIPDCRMLQAARRDWRQVAVICVLSEVDIQLEVFGEGDSSQ